MNLQFNTNPSFLSTRLFNPDKPRIGANTFLNVNVLPDFLEYIKRNLRPEELISLSEYQLQTFIMELSIKEKVTQSLDSFVQKILTYLRSRKQFWINGIIVGSRQNQEKQKQQQKHQHQAIIQYQKDIQLIQSKIPNYPQKIIDNKKKRRIHPYIQILNTDFIDKLKQVTKLNVTNYSMMPSYVLRDYLKDQNGAMKLPKYQNLGKDQLSLLNILENAVQYFLMQQKPRNIKNQNVKRRQVFRERRLPAHLINNMAEPIQQQEKIDDEASLYSKQSHQIGPLDFHQGHQKKVKNNLQDGNQKIEEESSQNSGFSYQEVQNKFYLRFHEQISKKQFYDSKMFSKQVSINQSHNIMEILRCLIYIESKKQDVWFDKKWKECEQERVQKSRRKQHQQQSDKNQQIEVKNQLQNKANETIQNQTKNIICQNENKNKSQKDQQNIKSNGNQNQQLISNNQNQQQKGSNQDQIIQQSQECSKDENRNQQKEQIIQIGIRKPIFDETWKNPHIYSYKKLSKHLSDNFLSMREVYFVTKQFVNRKIMKQLNFQKQLFIKRQKASQRIQDGLLDPQDINLDEILFQFKQMIDHPQNVKLGAFKTQGIKIPWQDSDYLMFLKGLREYFFIPTNNRKIAQVMMSKNNKKTIEANHVKYVKAIYLKNMQVRIDKGQFGGGKKGKMLGKTEFIDRDIESFSMRWFDKMKKSKKKLRRRRFDDDRAGQQVDSAY